MTGHDQVIYARSRGEDPPCVFMEDALPPPNPRDRAWLDVENVMCMGGLPVIYVGDEDPTCVDLSFLRRLRVHLVGDEVRGIERWCHWYAGLQALPVSHLLATYDGEVIEWHAETT